MHQETRLMLWQERLAVWKVLEDEIAWLSYGCTPFAELDGPPITSLNKG